MEIIIQQIIIALIIIVVSILGLSWANWMDGKNNQKYLAQLFKEGDKVEVIGTSDFPVRDHIGQIGIVIDRWEKMVTAETDYSSAGFMLEYKVKFEDVIVVKYGYQLKKV